MANARSLAEMLSQAAGLVPILVYGCSAIAGLVHTCRFWSKSLGTFARLGKVDSTSLRP